MSLKEYKVIAFAFKVEVNWGFTLQLYFATITSLHNHLRATVDKDSIIFINSGMLTNCSFLTVYKISSLGMISKRKSYISVSVIAYAISFLYKVFL